MDNYNGQSFIADWYKNAFPSDSYGYLMMNKSNTFQDAFECLQVGFDFYTFLGVSDSLVRERVFDALATLMGCSYDHLYYQWLNHSKNPLEGRVITDMSGLRFKKDDRDEKIAELEKRVSDAGWQYEYDHADDWRKPTEMGQL